MDLEVQCDILLEEGSSWSHPQTGPPTSIEPVSNAYTAGLFSEAWLMGFDIKWHCPLWRDGFWGGINGAEGLVGVSKLFVCIFNSFKLASPWATGEWQEGTGMSLIRILLSESQGVKDLKWEDNAITILTTTHLLRCYLVLIQKHMPQKLSKMFCGPNVKKTALILGTGFIKQNSLSCTQYN